MAGPFELALSQFAKEAGERADQAVRSVVLEIHSRVTVRSPVDTGRFRANWRYGVGAAPTDTVETTGTSESPSPAAAAPAMGPGEGIGRVHYLANNLPYAWALERGHSRQAPIGMVGLTAMEFAQIVDGVVAGLGSISVTGMEE